jgi:TonB family protein
VSDEPHGATTIRASKGSGGGAGKWLIGGLAAVVLAGGGYAAYKTVGPGAQQQQNAEIAYDDQYGDDPLRAGPLESEDNLAAESAATDEVAPAPAAPARRSTARRQVASADTIPEETFGVTPASVTTEEIAAETGDDIVVRARPRPVWTRTPSERRLASLYPVRALERGREGEARLGCTVQQNGALACTTLEETPGGFGTAAQRVARTLRHAPTRADGTDAIGTPVNLRVVFRLEDEDRQRFASR